MLLSISGLVSNGPTGGAFMDEGPSAIIVGAVLGAFCGLLFGIVLTHLVRFFSFMMGRHTSGYAWAILSMVLGAIAFAWMAVSGDNE